MSESAALVSAVDGTAVGSRGGRVAGRGGGTAVELEVSAPPAVLTSDVQENRLLEASYFCEKSVETRGDWG